MYRVRFSTTYKKSIKKIRKSGNIKIQEVDFVVNILVSGKKLPDKFRDHKLQGEFKEYRECHARPDLLLVYQIQDDVLILLLVNIGSHAELFS